MTTDRADTFGCSMMKLVGADMARDAARRVYDDARASTRATSRCASCTTASRRTSSSATRRSACATKAARDKFVADGDNTYGGRVVTNPSGGLLSKGHPLGATGLAQCYELTQQLRGTADKRQVEGARLGLQHNLGLGGACVVTLYERTT